VLLHIRLSVSDYSLRLVSAKDKVSQCTRLNSGHIDMYVVQRELSTGATVRLAASSRSASAFSASSIYTTIHNKQLPDTLVME